MRRTRRICKPDIVQLNFPLIFTEMDGNVNQPKKLINYETHSKMKGNVYCMMHRYNQSRKLIKNETHFFGHLSPVFVIEEIRSIFILNININISISRDY